MPAAQETSAFITHSDTCFETRPEYLDTFLTPNERFFVRSNASAPAIDLATYQLTVEGDGLEGNGAKLKTFSYGDLIALPSRTVVAALECAGNHRAMFDLVQGQPAATDDVQWKTGAIGNAVWTGVPLRCVLEQAGVRDDAVDVMFIGLDTGAPEGGFRRVIPFARAIHPDTLLAYTMNGVPLPQEHGFPLRALVPGWAGITGIKWLGGILVSTERLWARNNTSHYVLIGDNYPPEGEAPGIPVTEQAIKSALALPWPAQLAPGRHMLRGYAHSPGRRIARVDWSDDDGVTWHPATVLEPQVQYSWARFEFVWTVRPGTYTLLTRATDEAGNTQPDTVPFNEKGYLFNRPIPHSITVQG